MNDKTQERPVEELINIIPNTQPIESAIVWFDDEAGDGGAWVADDWVPVIAWSISVAKEIGRHPECSYVHAIPITADNMEHHMWRVIGEKKVWTIDGRYSSIEDLLREKNQRSSKK